MLVFRGQGEKPCLPTQSLAWLPHPLLPQTRMDAARALFHDKDCSQLVVVTIPMLPA
jgi:hypothetical protein